MTLEEYHAKRTGTLRDLADHLGITGQERVRTVQRYVEHERIPDRATMRQIEEKTGGKVTFSDWPDRPFRTPKRERLAQATA